MQFVMSCELCHLPLPLSSVWSADTCTHFYTFRGHRGTVMVMVSWSQHRVFYGRQSFVYTLPKCGCKIGKLCSCYKTVKVHKHILYYTRKDCVCTSEYYAG